MIFDYIYFRIAKFFFKRDGSDGVTAISIISLMQACIIVAIIVLILKLTSLFEIAIISGKALGCFSAIIAVALMRVNFLFYKKKYHFLRSKWINESINKKRINGILVIFGILAPILFLLFVLIAF
jgi:hypothetical protein